jgi:Rrf2 family protein
MPYLSKLLHRLGQEGIVVAKRGTFGGYALAAPPQQTSLLQIARAVEGESWMPKCLLGFAECSIERACPTHDFWTEERARIEAVLSQITVRDVARFERQRRGRHGSCCEPPVTPEEHLGAVEESHEPPGPRTNS